MDRVFVNPPDTDLDLFLNDPSGLRDRIGLKFFCC